MLGHYSRGNQQPVLAVAEDLCSRYTSRKRLLSRLKPARSRYAAVAQPLHSTYGEAAHGRYLAVNTIYAAGCYTAAPARSAAGVLEGHVRVVGRRAAAAHGGARLLCVRYCARLFRTHTHALPRTRPHTHRSFTAHSQVLFALCFPHRSASEVRSEPRTQRDDSQPTLCGRQHGAAEPDVALDSAV